MPARINNYRDPSMRGNYNGCIVFFFPVALQSLKDLSRLTYRRFLEVFRHMVGLLGRVISPSQLPAQDNTTQKDADKHPCLERDSNSRSQQPTAQDPHLRPHGQCDRHNGCMGPKIRVY
jgi:hypothetical protein